MHKEPLFEFQYRIMLNGFGYAIFGIPARDLESTWKGDIPPAGTPGQLPLLLNSPQTPALEVRHKS